MREKMRGGEVKGEFGVLEGRPALPERNKQIDVAAGETASRRCPSSSPGGRRRPS